MFLHIKIDLRLPIFLVMKKLLTGNLVKLIYIFVCKIYNFFVTCFENFFYKKSNGDIALISKGYFKRDIKDIDLKNIQESRKVRINDYLYIYHPNNKLITNLILNIFSKEFIAYISKITGFNYSIDYMIMYDRKYIEKFDRKKNTLDLWYSYKWHFDKPNSNNTLKLILPINISSKHGPLTALDTKTSKKVKVLDDKYLDGKTYAFTGELNKIYGFFPAKCLHKDGIPDRGKTATQIMFQLNPSKKWSINSKLSRRNPNLNDKLKIWTDEPKFTFLTCMRDHRINLING